MSFLEWNSWKWFYEIAPLQEKVMLNSLTSGKQEFLRHYGLKSEELFRGQRIPQTGELVYLPGFDDFFKVSGLRSPQTSAAFSKKAIATVWFNSDDFKGALSPRSHSGKAANLRIPRQGWNVFLCEHSDYRTYGFQPSDWSDPDLKFQEREYILSWTAERSTFLAPDGRTFSRLEPHHRYLFDWFPDVEQHIRSLHPLGWH